MLVLRRLTAIPQLGLPRFRYYENDDFDSTYGVDTGGRVQLVQTDSPNFRHGHRYTPAAEKDIRWCIEECGLCLEHTTFVDLGSGKGRALIVAGEYPFHHIVGVEYSPILAAVSQRNIDAVQLNGRCTIIVADAAAYDFPDGDLFIFLYNPFDAYLMTTVLKNLAATRGTVRIGYVGPGDEVICRSGVTRTIHSRGAATIFEFLRPLRSNEVIC